MTSTAGVILIEAALQLDRAEALWDDPTGNAYEAHRAHEKAKREFRKACADYRGVAHGEPVTTGG